MKTKSWFKNFFGFKESEIPSTNRHAFLQEYIEIRNEDSDQGEIFCKKKGKGKKGKTYRFGRLEIASLANLRAQVQVVLAKLPTQKNQVSEIVGDVSDFHEDPQNENAVFQVASQFNLLEMLEPELRPEDGITIYCKDGTQGPACALSAPAGTLYRNYFVKVNPNKPQRGQTYNRQIHTLAALEKALGVKLKRQNGYVFVKSVKQLSKITDFIAKQTPEQRDALMQLVEVGIQWNTEVNDAQKYVQQVYASALAISYHDHVDELLDTSLWPRFASLVLDAAYEATLLTTILNLAKNGCGRVYLTTLGGGVFGNKHTWIYGAIEKTIAKMPQVGLDIKVVSYKESKPIVNEMINRIVAQIP
jgi:hypothetical protein